MTRRPTPPRSSPNRENPTPPIPCWPASVVSSPCPATTPLASHETGGEHPGADRTGGSGRAAAARTRSAVPAPDRREGQTMIQGYDPRTGQPAGDPVPETDGAGVDAIAEAAAAARAPWEQ